MRMISLKLLTKQWWSGYITSATFVGKAVKCSHFITEIAAEDYLRVVYEEAKRDPNDIQRDSGAGNGINA